MRKISATLALFILSGSVAFAQVSPTPFVKGMWWNASGSGPCAACLMYTYSTGTTTPKTSYTDSTGGTPNANPVVLDSVGRANIWLAAGKYTLVLKTAAGATIWTVDGIPGDQPFIASGSGTLNTLPKFTATQQLGDSHLSDNGTTLTVDELMTVNGAAAFVGSVSVGANLTFSPFLPIISSGCGTSPSITSGLTSAFRVNVGTGGAASSCVIGLSTAAHGWNCDVKNITGQAANRADQRTVQTASSTTTVTVQNQTISTGAALAWTASDILAMSCVAF